MSRKGPKQKFPVSPDGTVSQELITVNDREADAHYDFAPDEVVRVSRSGNVFLFKCRNGAQLEAAWLGDRMLRFRYAAEDPLERDFSYAIDPAFKGQEQVGIEAGETHSHLILTSRHLRCHIEKSGLLVHIADQSGNWICRDHQGYFSRRTILKGKIRVSVSKQHTPADHYFGLGDKGGRLRLNGRSFENWNTDAYRYGPDTDPLYKSIPFYYGLRNGKAYGIFLDNPFRTRFDFGKTNPSETRLEAEGGELRYYFFFGPELGEVARQFALLTGKPELPPLWALGFHQSRWSYFPDSRVRDIARLFREKQIPCDAIYLDIDYMDGFRCFTWNKGHFPDPSGLISDLKKEGFKTVVMIDPGIKADPDYEIYRDGMENDVFCYRTDGDLLKAPVWPGECVFPDFTDPKVRKWWGLLYRELYIEQGVAGFWNDMNEPAVFKTNHLTFPDEVRHEYDGQATNHRKAHNVYGQQMSRATCEGLKALDPGRRPFVLTRASFAGGQRHAATWTGDNHASWEHLRLAHVQVQRLSISGFGFCGSDIGGFAGQPAPELLLRWLQMGVFHPFFRVHSMGNNLEGAGITDPDWVHAQEAVNRLDQEPWVFGPEWERLNRRAIESRYQWLPYLYTCFYDWVENGNPILRSPLFLDQEDHSLRDYEDAVAVGPDVLVFPVWQAGQKTRTIYLPKGEWRDYRTGKAFAGGKKYKLSLALSHIPIMVRAGAVLPHHPVRQSTADPARELVLRVYPVEGQGPLSRLYEDAGEGYGYSRGEFSIFSVQCSVEGEELKLRIWRKGSYVPEYERIRIEAPGRERVWGEVLTIDPFPGLGQDPFFETAFKAL